MTLQVRVQGGTNAGTRKPLDVNKSEPWRCGCGPGTELRPASWVNCPYCGSRRPQPLARAA